MQECKPVKVFFFVGVRLFKEKCPKTQEEEEGMSHVPYASDVGSLIYSMVCTRPELSHAVGVLSKYVSKLRKEHWIDLESVFTYLLGTIDHAIFYQGRSILARVLDVHGFVDADWVGYLDHRRSTSGYVFNLFGGTISCMSKKQVVVALSTTKAKYMAVTHESKKVVSWQRLCLEIGCEIGCNLVSKTNGPRLLWFSELENIVFHLEMQNPKKMSMRHVRQVVSIQSQRNFLSPLLFQSLKTLTTVDLRSVHPMVWK